MKKGLFKWLRLFVAVALLCYLLNYIGIEKIQILLKSTNPSYLIVFYGLLSIDAFLRSVNWNALLRTRKHFISLWEMIYNYIVGGFFGTFVPSTLGTDFSRALLASRRNNISLQDSALVVVVLNILGLFALCLVSFLGALLLVLLDGNKAFLMLIIPFCFACILLFLFLIKDWLPEIDRKRSSFFALILIKISDFSAALRAFKQHQRTLFSGFIISFLNQLIGILMVYSIAMALDLTIPFLFFVAYVPLINLFRLIPFSVAGFGADQGIFVLLLTQAGATAAEAFMTSIVLSVSMVGFWLFGGALFIFENFYLLFADKNKKRR